MASSSASTASTASTAVTLPGVSVGQRVRDKKKGSVGTVRYIGPVATSKKASTIYIGIEWDDAGRGKNDGSVTKKDTGEVVRYFTAPASGASFMKPALVDLGQSFLTALIDKYEGSKLVSDDVGAVSTASGRELPIEFVGEDLVRSQQRLKRNPHISLKDSSVSSVESNGIAEVAPNVSELDLRGNLLSSWNDIVALGLQLPRLSVLNLGQNRLLAPTPTQATNLTASLKTLRVLVLSGTRLSWDAIHTAAAALPALTELHACDNGLATFGVAATADATAASAPAGSVAGLEQLEVLNLAENQIDSWAQVWAFSKLPKLKTLLLHSNKLASIAYWPDAAGDTAGAGASGGAGGGAGAGAGAGAGVGAGTEPAGPFATLSVLSLNDNSMADWGSVDVLNSFPSLTTLRMVRNPVVEEAGPSRARQTIIARVQRLTRLNNSEVRLRERIDAEKLYLRHVSAAVRDSAGGVDLFEAMGSAQGDTVADKVAGLLADNSGLQEALKPHPRFLQLVAHHGPEMLAAAAGAGASSLASSVVKVTLCSMAASSCTMEPVSRKLPLSMTVANLKQMLFKLFECDVSLQRLAFKVGGGYMPTPLDDDLQPLSYFGVTEGCQIFMEEIDPKAAARAKAEADAAQEARMAAQLAEVELAQQVVKDDVRKRQAAAASGQ